MYATPFRQMVLTNPGQDKKSEKDWSSNWKIVQTWRRSKHKPQLESSKPDTISIRAMLVSIEYIRRELMYYSYARNELNMSRTSSIQPLADAPCNHQSHCIFFPGSMPFTEKYLTRQTKVTLKRLSNKLGANAFSIVFKGVKTEAIIHHLIFSTAK